MKSRLHRVLWHGLLVAGGLWAAASQADVVTALQSLRAGGCGGMTAAAPPLTRSIALDHAAARWADGAPAATAVQAVGYPQKALVTFHLTGQQASTDALLKHLDCRKLADPGLRDLGLYQRGADTWLVLATVRAGKPATRDSILVARPPAAPAAAASLASRSIELINEARAHGARCGSHTLRPVPPVHLSAQLSDVALGHAADMATHNYFEHEDLSGHSPADRVRAAGYQEKLVGENIAYGPTSADEVVRGWLDSPGHCENIMDERFSEMGIAYVPGKGSKPGLYWVQVFAEPRT